MNQDQPQLPNDNLDPLLRSWHQQNSDRAAQLRSQTLARVKALPAASHRPHKFWIGRGLAAAAMLAIAITGAFLLPIFPTHDAFASGGTIMVAGGGNLNAFDRQGQVLGPCPLAHTDVKVDISGPFTRVTLVQKFQNPYRVPIEAVYTFPLGERSAVDSMRMIVRGPTGERVVDGTVKERSLARFIYQSARDQGYVASLLEQERPNIFTQSVANIETGATVDVEISYIETLSMQDGTYEFAFPMVVTPRYIPGGPSGAQPLPAGWSRRDGVILLGPAGLEAGLAARLERAIPVQPPSAEQLALLGEPTVNFSAAYVDGSREPGAIYASGAGQVGGRWFVQPSDDSPSGSGFSRDTNQVPDASRITPMPVLPHERAGHDISIAVNIDTGGPELRDLVSQLHGVQVKWNGNTRCSLQLQGGNAIPNKDFVLNWGLKGTSVLEGVFAFDSGTLESQSKNQGGFVTLVMNPPPPTAGVRALPRELVFVMDTSGSMSGQPMEKSKEVMRKSLAAMRQEDRFNVVTFAGSTAVLWPDLRPASKDNVEEALKFVEGRRAGGGTEMMKAIEAALVQMPGKTPATNPDGSIVVPPRTPISPQQAGAQGDDERGAEPAPAPPPMRVAIFLTDGEIGNDQGVIAAVAANAGTTRVFTFGIGNSINRYLLQEMARRGRGACDIVLTTDDADKAVELFARRLQTPVLQDITVAFEGVQVTDLQPSGALLPDLFDVQPLVIHGRWSAAGSGAVVVRGRTAEGPYERRIPVSLRAGESKATMLPQLWARAKVDAILQPHLLEVERQTLANDIRSQVVNVGETFQIVTPYTSFVAVERSRMVVGGKPMLVTVPIEFPEGLRWEGFFGTTWCNDAILAAARAADGGVSRGEIGQELLKMESKSFDQLSTVALSGLADTHTDTAVRMTPATRSESRQDLSLLGAEVQERFYFDAHTGRAAGGGGATLNRRRLDPAAPLPVASPAIGSRDGAAGGGFGERGAGKAGAPAGRPTAPPPPPPPASAAPADRENTGSATKESDEKQKVADKSAAPSEAPAPHMYLVQAGDTLSSIALAKYGNASYWREILEANTTLLAGNERSLQVGMQITIPPRPTAATPAAATPTAATPTAATPSEPAPTDAGAVAATPKSIELPQEQRDRLVRVLERRLLALALYERLDADARRNLPALPAEVAALARSDAGSPPTVAITVLVAAAGDDVLATLAKAGLRAAVTGEAGDGATTNKRIVLGEAKVSDLISLASLPGVLRIEPQELKEVPPAGR